VSRLEKKTVSALKRARDLICAVPNRIRYKRGLAHSRLETAPPRLTTPTFLGHETLRLADECVSSTADIPIDEIWSRHFAWGGRYFGAYDYWETRVLCGLIRKFRVDNVVECSPNQGWSTLFMRLARPLKSHVSFDIEDFEGAIRSKLRDYGVERGWEFVLGDFRRKGLEYVRRIEDADVLFIDADHRLDFAVWYMETFKILDVVKPGCLVHIHDIYPQGKEPPSPDFGESPYIVDFLSRNRGRFDILFNYEMCRQEQFQSKYPKNFFLNHFGAQAHNPSVWFVKSLSQNV